MLSLVTVPLRAWLGALMRTLFGRWTRRSRAAREFQQIRMDAEKCAAFFVADTQGGTVPQRPLPTGSAGLISALHADGLLTDRAFSLLREFFGPAEQANALLAAPAHQGPPLMSGALRLACLLQGRRNVQVRDGNGFTLYDRAMGELAEAITRINLYPV